MIYLNKSAWTNCYNDLNDNVQKDFFKLETLPSYNDYGIYDWDSIHNADMYQLIVKAQQSVSINEVYIKNQIDRGVNLIRIRFLQFPLSKYILRQFSVYKVYQDLGLSIEILEDNSIGEWLDLNYFRDFLLFDNEKLLLIDNPNGCFNGGFYTDDPSEIQPFLNIRNLVSERTIPFDTYLNNFNIFNKILIKS